MKWGWWWARTSMMALKNHALLVALYVVAVVPVVFNMKCLATRKTSWDVIPPGCINCTICPYSCHPVTPPALPDYPLGRAPPPPPATLPYPSDVVPPPPPPPPSNCTTVPVQCCQYPYNTPPQTGYGYQPQPVTPPVGYGFQPVGSYSATLSSSPLHLVSVMLLLLFIVALL